MYEWLGFKLQMNLAPEAGISQGMVDVDLKVGPEHGDNPLPEHWNYVTPIKHPAATTSSALGVVPAALD